VLYSKNTAKKTVHSLKTEFKQLS